MPDKNKIILGTNDDTYIAADDAGNIVLQHEQGQRVALTNSSIEPATDETLDLGSPTNKFKDLYLSSDSIFIGNTKLSSDPATGALSTVVADEQGQFTAPSAPVGGSSNPRTWKGSSKHIAANDPININGEDTVTSMEYLYDLWITNNYNPGTTLPFELVWGNFIGNPNHDHWYNQQFRPPHNPILYSQGYDNCSVYIMDENGDDLSAFLVNYMDENNSPILNFEFSINAKLQVQDPVKAAQIPYFQQGLYNNLTDVTTVPLFTIKFPHHYAFKSNSTNSKRSTRGIHMAALGDPWAGFWSPSSAPYDWVSHFFLGDQQNQFNQPDVFERNLLMTPRLEVGAGNYITLNTKLQNAATGLISTDPDADTPGYFDLQDGIVFDMVVNIK